MREKIEFRSSSFTFPKVSMSFGAYFCAKSREASLNRRQRLLITSLRLIMVCWSAVWKIFSIVYMTVSPDISYLSDYCKFYF